MQMTPLCLRFSSSGKESLLGDSSLPVALPPLPISTVLEGTSNRKISKNFGEEIILSKMHTSSKTNKRDSRSSQKSKFILIQNYSFFLWVRGQWVGKGWGRSPAPSSVTPEAGDPGCVCREIPRPGGPAASALSLHAHHPSASLAAAPTPQRARTVFICILVNSGHEIWSWPSPSSSTDEKALLKCRIFKKKKKMF